METNELTVKLNEAYDRIVSGDDTVVKDLYEEWRAAR